MPRGTPFTPDLGRDRFGVLVGRSVVMRDVFARLERAAAGDATVLLEGPTGTGKEAAAVSIHRASARRDGPFVIVDCGAIPSPLLEAELFGHEKGAFTGAIGARVGAFEAAAGGTVFLDEIGELAPELQPKLLRVLEARHVKRIGSNDYAPVDVRVIAATNRNLRVEASRGAFRSDLYYRLAVLRLRLPALAERPDDLPLLVDTLLERLGVVDAAEAALVRAPDFLEALARHEWPGNVRELRNYVERCLALGERVPFDPPAEEDTAAPPAADAAQPLKAARASWNRAFEKRYLEDALRRHADNVAAAARAAQVDRMYFYRLLWRHRLR